MLLKCFTNINQIIIKMKKNKNAKVEKSKNQIKIIKSDSIKESRKSSLNDTISELEKNPKSIKDKFKNLLENDSEVSDPNAKKIIFDFRKFLFAVFFLALAFTNSYFKLVVPKNEPIQITDFTHIHTINLYNFLLENSYFRKSLVNTTAFFQDFGYLILCYYWITKGVNYRPIIAFIMLFLFKLLNSWTFTFAPIEGYIWDSPNYSSLTYVTEGKNSNLFFSGQVGFNFLLYEFLCDFKTHFSVVIGLTCLINSLFQSSFMIVTRSAYVIDVGTSLFAAHYFYYLSLYISPVFDNLYPIRDKAGENAEKLESNLLTEEEKISNLENDLNCKVGLDELFIKRKKQKFE